MKNNKKSVKIKIIGAILTVLVIIISVLFLDKNSTISLWKILGIDTQKELAQGIKYQIYKYTDGTGKMLITFTDNESEIVSIDLNDDNEIKCNRNSVSIDYDINSNETYVFKMRSKNGREIVDSVTIDEDFLQNNGIKMTNKKTDTANYKVINLTYSLLDNTNYKKQYKIAGGEWQECENEFVVFDSDVKEVADENDEIRIYVRAINKSNTNEIVEVSKKYKVDMTATSATIEVESLIAAVQDESFFAGKYQLKVNDEIYGVHAYTLDESQVWTKNTTFGTAGDVGAKNTYAQNMVIVKINGDLTINSGVTVGPYYTEYGGPKGFLLYVTGKLINNGTIDNSHGAYAKGQNVYLWKNADESYEYVPAVGGAGGSGVADWGTGIAGDNGIGRQTGGGGSANGGSGNGGAGTSYSGGAGSASLTTVAASSEGGAGTSTTTYQYDYGAGGAGNPGGRGTSNGSNGTGGLLIIYAGEYINNGQLTALGANGGQRDLSGGSSGGGSINIFTERSTGIDQLGISTNTRYAEILGSTSMNGGIRVVGRYGSGGPGGTGTVNIGEIRDGQYYDLKTCIEQDKEELINSVSIQGDSILSLLDDDSLTNGNYCFEVNNEKYPVHLYVYNEDQTFTSNMTFGDDNDISKNASATSTEAAHREYAQNMVIVKVNGDLTINSGVTVGPYYTSNGGPKGFLIYVTGTLTNNGTIDNSHGAYAKGQNVYLWKNTDGTYEYVPAIGGTGGTGVSGTFGTLGINGDDGIGRQTGGGGSANADSGDAGAGTSYSGGAGSASLTTVAASSEGGAGTSTTTYQYDHGAGGAGNPGGNGSGKGENGTGGLIVIYADKFINNGKLAAVGAKGAMRDFCGGSSGGGSINIFARNDITVKGNIDVSGGIRVVGRYGSGGAGGKGTVTIGSISTGTFVEN